ncbi:MAG: acetoacetate decarboxylase family protein [Pseudomonadota bacterium]
MAYAFDPKHHYRMPTHFGPSLGPRQGLDGRRFSCKTNPLIKTFEATFEAEASQLEDLLPTGFKVFGEARLTIQFGIMMEVEWLAGRTYNVFGVSVPAHFEGKQDNIIGDFLLVLWENKADPIITGREDLGFSKVYCELPEPIVMDDRVECRASWDGHEFSTFSLRGKSSIDPEELPDSPSQGDMHLKYIPRTWTQGEADVHYPVLTAEETSHEVIEEAYKFEDASIKFKQSTWEQLPTLVHVVNGLADLKIGNCLSANLIVSRGGSDLSGQRPLV